MMDRTQAWMERISVRGTLTLLLSLVLIATASAQPPQGPPDNQSGPGGMPQQGPPPSGMPGGPGGPGGPPGMMPPPAGETKITPIVFINDGVYEPQKVAKATVSGKVENDSASGLTITTHADKLNALYVKGSKSSFTLSDSTFDLHGNGANDFAGVGAAAMADDGATLVLKNVKITTNGTIASTTTVQGKSILKVYDSTLIANGGPLPKGYVPKIGPGMMGPPPPLGITGTARATLTMGESQAFYYNSTIIADGWGAMSTDAAHGAYLEVNHCDVQVRKSGYGTYADNGAKVVINDSKMTTATYQGIIAGEASLAFNDVTGTSGVSSVMIHSVMGRGPEVSQLEIKGGKIETQKAVVLIKSANADVTIDHAELASKNGTLIQSIVNDDKNATKVNGQVPGIQATIKNSTLEGAILHEDRERGMSVAFMGATLKGAIKNASLSLDAASKWTATADSTVTLVNSVDVSEIDAPAGVTIAAVAGKDCNLKGTYKLASGGVLNVQAN